jgi:adenylosuccinate synthase
MFTEARHLMALGVMNAMDRTTVSGKALIVTPYQQALNQLTEMARGENRHGSCGQGIGQTRSDHLAYGDNVLFAADTRNPKSARKKLDFIRERAKEKVEDLEGSKLPDTPSVNRMLRLFEYSGEGHRSFINILGSYEYWAEQLVVNREEAFEDDVAVFEGAQGVMLDETHGQAPYNTWTDCTFNNCFEIISDSYGLLGLSKIERVGVMRSYMTRHGAGPFPTEVQSLSYPEPHNEASEWQGKFRFGKLDVPLIKKSVEILSGVDWIAMNHLDQFSIPKDSLGAIAYNLGAEIALKGYGPTADDKLRTESYGESVGGFERVNRLDNKTGINYT